MKKRIIRNMKKQACANSQKALPNPFSAPESSGMNLTEAADVGDIRFEVEIENLLRLMREHAVPIPHMSDMLPLKDRYLHLVSYVIQLMEPPTTISKRLIQEGVPLPPPDQLEDSELTYKLFEIFAAAFEFGVQFSSTDHLSDRELYERLWTTILNEKAVFLPRALRDKGYGINICDLVSGGSDLDTQEWLQYYADDFERKCWAEDWPGDAIPPKTSLPYDRDRHLPRIT